jgi:flagellar basal body-associated protein FliL
MIKIVALVGGVLLLCAGVVAAVVMGVIPVPFGPLAEARALAEKAKPPVTVMYVMKERVVNLTDKSASKYLKIAMSLEFIDTKVKDPPKGAAVLAQQVEFAGEMSPYAAVIDDVLGSTLSSKTSADLIKADGKEQLKSDLILNVNHALHDEEKVVNVYFTSFIIQ